MIVTGNDLFIAYTFELIIALRVACMLELARVEMAVAENKLFLVYMFILLSSSWAWGWNHSMAEGENVRGNKCPCSDSSHCKPIAAGPRKELVGFVTRQVSTVNSLYLGLKCVSGNNWESSFM